MAESPVPPTWFKFDFPLKNVPGAPVPSQADYSPQNVAWLIEMFAAAWGKDKTKIIFHYENNTPDDPYDDIFVQHPNDGRMYYAEEVYKRHTASSKSEELIHYEEHAKASARLRLYEKYSPANIEYFQDSPF